MHFVWHKSTYLVLSRLSCPPCFHCLPARTSFTTKHFCPKMALKVNTNMWIYVDKVAGLYNFHTIQASTYSICRKCIGDHKQVLWAKFSSDSSISDIWRPISLHIFNELRLKKVNWPKTTVYCGRADEPNKTHSAERLYWIDQFHVTWCY